MKRLPCLLSCCLLAACGNDPNGLAAVTGGSVRGVRPALKSAVAYASLRSSVDLLVVLLSNAELACSARGPAMAGRAQVLELVLLDSPGDPRGNGAPLAPVQDLVHSTTTPHASSAFADTDSHCRAVEEPLSASSGTVTLSEYRVGAFSSHTEQSGEFDLTLSNGDTLQGTFQARVCNSAADPAPVLNTHTSSPCQ
jgi:hypothetical protein